LAQDRHHFREPRWGSGIGDDIGLIQGDRGGKHELYGRDEVIDPKERTAVDEILYWKRPA
jgi:hypothetical protein